VATLRKRFWLRNLTLSLLVSSALASWGLNAAPSTLAETDVVPGIRTELVASGLAHPIYATAPAGDTRLFIVEQGGKIQLLKNGQVLATPFLDISTLTAESGEQGLLGLAFPPDYGTSGLFYINYTNLSGTTVIARYQVSGNADVANPASAEIILTVTQPGANHNAGQLAFGPDGYLYISMGDGGGYGGTGDYNNAQMEDTLLGKMLRLDVSGGLGSGYSIPLDNPYVGDTPLDEIWAWGLRNPYRWSFDRSTGDIYIADVGAGTWEEVDVEPAGGSGEVNYGWPKMEGTSCYDPPTGCNDGSLTLPVHTYDHLAGRCAIMGGFVYRGLIESIQGHYFFADWCTGQIWTFVWDGSDGIHSLRERTSELAPTTGDIVRVAGFGEDGSGELYIVDRGNAAANGEVFRVVARELTFIKGEAP
jgi:glucose/arabinose dehydrogenase